MPQLAREGRHLHYRFSGCEAAGAPVLIFAHSLGSDLDAWQPQCQALGDRFRLLRYDLPGHGASAAGSWPEEPGPDPLRPYGEDVLALMDHLAVDQACFCGLSLGGMIGQWLAARAAHRIDRLVLSSSTAQIDDPTLLKHRLRQLAESPRPDLSSIADHVLAGWFTKGYRESAPNEIAAHRARLMHVSPAAYTATAEAVCAADLRNELGAIRAPTLVIWGEDDPATPPAWNQAIARAIPNARGLALPGAHLVNVESSTRFNLALRAFLTASHPETWQPS